MFDTFPQSTSGAASLAPAMPTAMKTAVFLGEPSDEGRVARLARDAGLAVQHAESFEEVSSVLASNQVELIVLGAMPGGQLDLSACLQLSQRRCAPILAVTRSNDPTDRILALELGADDCASPDCSDREVAARMKSLTRRARLRDTDSSADDLCFSGWALNTTTGDLRHETGARSALTKMELIILKFFIRNIGKVVSRAEIHAACGAEPGESDRNVIVTIFRLRKKLEAGGESIIRTVRGLGYQLQGAVITR